MTSFGLMTAPSQVGYGDTVRVWREADAIPEIEHAQLYDHLVPLGGDPRGPTSRGLDAARGPRRADPTAAAGLMVTSNRFRPPALLAETAATVDAHVAAVPTTSVEHS